MTTDAPSTSAPQSTTRKLSVGPRLTIEVPPTAFRTETLILMNEDFNG